jgi:RNA polymerase sigma-70 factor (ECF subfamily)
MNQPAFGPARMDDRPSDDDARRAYEDLLVRALRYARRLLPREEAFEIAHDVAVEMLDRPLASQASGTTVYFAVIGRLRRAWRATDRRAARDRAYLESQSTEGPTWARPDAGLDASELRVRIAEAVARMPDAMRQTFLLVRQDELSYKEAAARLGVRVGTVHAQLSRANAHLRECLAAYRTDAPPAPRPGRSQEP